MTPRHLGSTPFRPFRPAAGLLVLALSIGSAGAQGLLAVPAGPGLQSAIAKVDREAVLVDAGTELVVASAPDWKAEFDSDGLRFVPFFGAAARTNHPLGLRGVAARVDGKTLVLAAHDAAPELMGQRVAYARGAWHETYDLSPGGVEQGFRFEDLPRRGELAIDIRTQGDWTASLLDGEVRFVCEEGAVSYGRAIAFDRSGARCAVATELVEGLIRLVVPADFVAKAQLPLVVDPMVATVIGSTSSTRELRALDMAWDAVASRYVACWERVWSQTDSDVFALLLDGVLVEQGSALVIDSSTVSWRDCAIAGLRSSGRCLVVAEVSAANASPFRVRGRMVTLTPTPSVLPAFDIAGAAVPGSTVGDRINPDVGGDPWTSPAHFTVVWERVYSDSDHDIQMVQVAADGTLRSATARTFDSSLALDHTPRISRSNGADERATQAWAVVWRRDNGAGSGHFRAGIVNHDGTLRTFGAAAATNLAITLTAPSYGTVFDVSSPTDAIAGRCFLLLDRRLPTGVGPDEVWGTVFDRDLFNIVPSTLIHSGSRNSGAGAVHGLSVDSDGVRFAMASSIAVSASDDDVLVRTFAVNGGTLVTHDEATAASGSERAISPVVVALRGGWGPALRFGLAWITRDAASTHGIGYGRYNGMGAGASSFVRNTGCGNVFVNHTGITALGQDVTVYVVGSGQVLAMIVGSPAQVPVPGCNGCVLGVDGSVLSGSSLPLTVPHDAAFFGGVVSIQGVGIGTGPCLSGISLSNTIDLIVR